MINDKAPKEPLITKAYDAFRRLSKQDQSGLMPTDEYMLELAKTQFEAKSDNRSNKTLPH